MFKISAGNTVTRELVTYYAAISADAAWSVELHRRFGRRAGDVRYSVKGSGAPGSELRRLHDAKLAADAEFFFVMRLGAAL